MSLPEVSTPSVFPVTDLPTAEGSAPTTPTSLPVQSPESIDVNRFNALPKDIFEGAIISDKPVDDSKRLFFRSVILDDQTRFDVETLKVPGFIGISDPLEVTDASGNKVSGHSDIVQFLDRDGLLVCTYQWNREHYGLPADFRSDPSASPFSQTFFQEGLLKNDGHHAGMIAPAQRLDATGQRINSYACLNQPSDYHGGMYGNGFLAVVQRLVFPEFVTPTQARGYTDSIICWMELLNPFIAFPSNFNGGDPTRVADRASLKEFLKNGLLACLGDAGAIAFLQDPVNQCYCAEFVYVSLNTPLYPFNKQGLTQVLDGDVQKAEQILAIQALHNQHQSTVLSQKTRNPQFQQFNLAMPLVPEDLLPLDQLLARQGQTVDPNSLPFPPFLISHLIYRTFRTLIPRQYIGSPQLRAVLPQMHQFLVPFFVRLAGVEALPEPVKSQATLAISGLVDEICQVLGQSYSSDAELDQRIGAIMQRANGILAGSGERSRFVPPRIYVDLGQNDGDLNLPQGWGFRLETVGALVNREVLQ